MFDKKQCNRKTMKKEGFEVLKIPDAPRDGNIYPAISTLVNVAIFSPNLGK